MIEIRSGPAPPQFLDAVMYTAYDGDRTVGKLMIVNLPHLEGAEVDSAYRGSTVFSRLMSACENHLKGLGATAVMAFAIDARIENYLGRLGYNKFATAWRKEF